jgi:hypothetical protein
MAHTCRAQAVQAKARKVELHPVIGTICEIAGECRVLCQKGIDELWPDLIGALADAGAEYIG